MTKRGQRVTPGEEQLMQKGDPSEEVHVVLDLPALRNPQAIAMAVAGTAGLGICAVLVVHPGRLSLVAVGVFVVLVVPYSFYSIYQGVWSYFGRERIMVTRHRLIVERRVLGVRAARDCFDLSMMRDLRADTPEPLKRGLAHPTSPSEGMGFGAGPVIFEYQGRQIRLCESLRFNPLAATDALKRIADAVGVSSDRTSDTPEC